MNAYSIHIFEAHLCFFYCSCNLMFPFSKFSLYELTSCVLTSFLLVCTLPYQPFDGSHTAGVTRLMHTAITPLARRPSSAGDPSVRPVRSRCCMGSPEAPDSLVDILAYLASSFCFRLGSFRLCQRSDRPMGWDMTYFKVRGKRTPYYAVIRQNRSATRRRLSSDPTFLPVDVLNLSNDTVVQ